MAMPTGAEMEIIKRNAETLRQLNDGQILMLALEALIMEARDMPPGTRFPLAGELRRRSGVKG